MEIVCGDSNSFYHPTPIKYAPPPLHSLHIVQCFNLCIHSSTRGLLLLVTGIVTSGNTTELFSSSVTERNALRLYCILHFAEQYICLFNSLLQLSHFILLLLVTGIYHSLIRLRCATGLVVLHFPYFPLYSRYLPAFQALHLIIRALNYSRLY